jgi:hypothetical protein
MPLDLASRGANWMVPLLFAFTGVAKKTVKANGMGVQFVLPLPSADSLRDVKGKRHDHRKVYKRTDYRCSTSPGGIQVVDLYFPKGGTTTKMME